MTEKTWKVHDVFGMSRAVPANYVVRTGVDDKLVNFLDRDQHVVIYGSSKQGKTCLRKHNLEESSYVVASCQGDTDLRQLHSLILKASGYSVQDSENRTVDGKGKIEAKIGLKFGIPNVGEVSASTGGGVDAGVSVSTVTKHLELDPSDANEIIAALKGISFSKFIVLEDFHYLPVETQKLFSKSLKAFHENSTITFIIVAVWREENRLILFNGDLTGRVVAIDADAWSSEQLHEVISSGEPMLNISFSKDFANELVNSSYESVYLVQESCYRACADFGILETAKDYTIVTPPNSALSYITKIIQEQGGRYKTFLQIFSAGFLTTELSMYKWVLYPIIISNVAQLEKGLSYRHIRQTIESRHPEGKRLKPGNLTQALQQISNLQGRKNLNPFVLDYDSANLLLSVVDKGFLIWLGSQDRQELLDLIDLEEYQASSSSSLTEAKLL